MDLDLQPEIQTLKVCTLIYDICVWHTLVKNKQMMYVIYDIGCQSLHGCEWRCRCFLSLFRQLCKCSFFVLCYMWPDTPLRLFSAPALKVTFLSQDIMALLRSLNLTQWSRDANTGCPIDIVPCGIRIFDIKGRSKNMNSINLPRRPMLFLDRGRKFFRKN